MATELIINATFPETRIALLENSEIQELHIERDSERGIVGNIYKGKVIRVLPGMQAAFVDIGLEKAAFLYVDDIFFPDMKTPLATQPLPEPVQKVQAQPGVAPQAGAEKQVGAGRGRGRGRQGRTVEPVKLPVPNQFPAGSPEAHAAAQAEYARQMLANETDAELEPTSESPVVEATSEISAEPLPSAVEATPVAAAGHPADIEAPSGQPQARSPQTEAEEEFEEETESEAPIVYRPEPLIDPMAWAEDVNAAQQGEQEAPVDADAQMPAPAPASIPVVELASTETEVPVPTTAEVVSESATEHVRDAEGGQAVQMREHPNVVPVKPLGVDEEDESGDEDEDSAAMPRRKRRREPVNIQDLVKEGQEILVQVAKDPIGTKGARLTCHVSLPGRYLVFMPTVDHIGVSRRIESEGERRRLKETIGKIRPAKTGVIVRTASGKQTDKKLKQDLDYLVTTWNDIQKKYNKQRTPSLVYQDLTIVLRAIRDMFTDEVDRVVVDSSREHKAIMRFVTRFIPQVKDKVELYQGEMPIFDAYGIETEISRALERKVWLKSGGYLVVDQAEALVAIDVNTGRYVGKKTLEETILKTNLEAVKEIAYQLRLRNCGGIIILDLIDMEKEANREKVYKALEEALKKDRARPTILKISQLGLVEMTRKRTRDSMVRSLCEPCSYCEGKGFVKNKLTISYDIMRDIEREVSVKDTQAISIQCHPSVADVLLEDKRDVIEDMERQFKKKITIRGNGAYHVEQYELVAHRDSKNMVWSSEERRQLLRHKINERQQQLAAEQRRKDHEERQRQAEERKKESEERRREAEERRRAAEAARAERRAAAEAKKQEVEAAKAAFFTERGLDPTVPLTPELESDAAWVSVLELEKTVATELAQFEPRVLVGNSGGQISSENSAGGGDSRRRRRRGRRGRGGRAGRNEGSDQQAQQGQQSHPPQGRRPQGRGQGQRPPRVQQLPRANVPEAPAPGGEAFEMPHASSEQLSPSELAGSAVPSVRVEGEAPVVGENAVGTGENQRAGRPDDPNAANKRRRRRGRRGGRRRRRGDQGPANGSGAEGRVVVAPNPVAPMAAAAPASEGGQGPGRGGEGGE